MTADFQFALSCVFLIETSKANLGLCWWSSAKAPDTRGGLGTSGAGMDQRQQRCSGALSATVPRTETHSPKPTFAPFSQQKFLLLLLQIFAWWPFHRDVWRSNLYLYIIIIQNYISIQIREKCILQISAFCSLTTILFNKLRNWIAEDSKK